jgi:hypothetical protein
MRFKYRHGQLLVLVAVWLLTRALVLSELGYLRHGTHVNYQDVNVFHDWANRIAGTHQLPAEPAWQYPPGAVIVFLLPRLIPGHYCAAFVGIALIADLITTIALRSMSQRGASTEGVWLWLLAIPALGTLPLLRFDMIPTCIAVVALTLAASRLRDLKFGILAGLGIAVKAWPVLLLLAVRSRRGARSTALAAAVTAAAFMVVSWFTLGNSFGFLRHQSGRGLELEAVAATPWYLRQAITGHPVHWVGRNGSVEIVSAKADLIAQSLVVAMLALAVALVAWWVTWSRQTTRAIPDVGRDAVFTAVLLFIVLSEVLSPQYLIWLIGIGAVAVASPSCRVRRPVATVAVAVLLTRALLACWGDLVSNGANGAYLLSIRNVVLVVAAVDATVTMWRVLTEARVRSLVADAVPGVLSANG